MVCRVRSGCVSAPTGEVVVHTRPPGRGSARGDDVPNGDVSHRHSRVKGGCLAMIILENQQKTIMKDGSDGI